MIDIANAPLMFTSLLVAVNNECAACTGDIKHLEGEPGLVENLVGVTLTIREIVRELEQQTAIMDSLVVLTGSYHASSITIKIDLIDSTIVEFYCSDAVLGHHLCFLAHQRFQSMTVQSERHLEDSYGSDFGLYMNIFYKQEIE